MHDETRRKFTSLLPWLITLASLALLLALGLIYRPSTIFGQVLRKSLLISEIRTHLLQSIEAEKNAILTMTDPEAKAFATQAEQAAEAVETNRKELESIVGAEPSTREAKLLEDFGGCWTQYRGIEEQILGIAGRNTNLKAKKLSFGPAAQQLEQLEASLRSLMRKTATDAQAGSIARLAYETLVASRQIQSLHAPHIEAAEDSVMDEIEKRIQASDASAREALGQLAGLTPASGSEELKSAALAYDGFMETTREILKLSRENTNVHSVELSLGKRQLLSVQCQQSLAELEEAIRGEELKATR